MDYLKFETFLESIDLTRYRKDYQKIKLVEMDMPKNIQAPDTLYKIYWQDKKLLDFENYYDQYKNSIEAELENFREEIGMCKVCFYKGLPARIYRTWASIITQIHAGYVAEAVFGKGKIEMGTNLDRSGIDFRVRRDDGNYLNFQVKKETKSREVRKQKEVKKAIELIVISYNVPLAATLPADNSLLVGQFKNLNNPRHILAHLQHTNLDTEANLQKSQNFPTLQHNSRND